MSETPTGTDRVELTDAEHELLASALLHKVDHIQTKARLVQDAVESIVAARLSALTAERDMLRGVVTRYEGTVIHQERRNALARLDTAEAERDALQATLDRVIALADEADRSERHINGYGYVLLHALRAALTPEADPYAEIREQMRQDERDRYQHLRSGVLTIADQMENPNSEHGTMPRVRMQVRREWASRLRELAALTPEGTK